jgi:predicted transcriptional regulator
VNSENVNRLQAKRLISLLPGVHQRMLSRLLGVSLSTTQYHLHNLEKDGEIVFWQEGEYKRAYPRSVEDERSKRIYALLQQGAARKIVSALLKTARGGSPSLTNNEISKITRLSQSTVSEYLSELRDLQLTTRIVTKEGRAAFEIAEADKDWLSSILSSFARNFLSRTTDNYISLWDF